MKIDSDWLIEAAFITLFFMFFLVGVSLLVFAVVLAFDSGAILGIGLIGSIVLVTVLGLLRR